MIFSFKRYLISIFIILICTLLQSLIWSSVDPAPFLLYYPAIVLASFFGDGILAVLLSSLAVQFYFVPPLHTLIITEPGGIIRQIVFIFSGLMIVVLAMGFKSAKKDAVKYAMEAQLNSEWLKATLISIGDAVIASDPQGRVSFMNNVAEKLTGWTEQESKNLPLSAVFSIVNETTRLRGENPVDKVLRVGSAVGFTGHMVLIRKDGSEIVVEDSAAPIFNEMGVLIGIVLVFRDSSEKRNNEAKLAFEKHQLETIFSESPAAMSLWTGIDLVFAKVNPQFQAIFPNRQLLGKPFLVACPEFKDQEFSETLKKVFVTGEPFVGKEVLARHPRIEGGPNLDFYYDFTYMRVNDVQGKPYGVYDHAIDVTDKVESKLKLVKALHNRDELLSVCSHELRTPVTSMKLSTQMFRRGLEKGDSKSISMDRVVRMVEQADRQLDKLARLIEEMLDFSRISGGRLQINPEVFDLVELTSETIDRIRPQFETNGVTLDFEKVISFIGKWDRFRLDQVITNLLSNALKYGSGNPVQVTISQGEKSVLLAVQDQGLGIPSDAQERIFKPYERAISVNSISGLGLGLYISHQIIEAHGGKIWVNSELDVGSTFTVSLPLL